MNTTRHKRRRQLIHIVLGTAAIASSVWAMPATAQSYPAKPLRLVVGYPPGGSGDFVSRTIADALGKELGVTVIVDNRPGAGGVIASEVVAKSPPDGYTLLNAGSPSVLKALYRKLPYNADTDFTPVSLVAVGPMIICVNNDLPVKNIRELIAYAKANPGKLNSAASGNGSSPHLASVQFEAVAGVKFTTVQFKGGGPAAVSLMAGDTQVMFATAPTVLSFIRSGRMRALALTSADASPAIPGIPGAREAGLEGYDESYSFGLYVPANTPAPIVKRLHEATARSLDKQEIREKIASQGMDAAPSRSPEDFLAQLRAEAPVRERKIAESGARIE